MYMGMELKYFVIKNLSLIFVKNIVPKMNRRKINLFYLCYICKLFCKLAIQFEQLPKQVNCLWCLSFLLAGKFKKEARIYRITTTGNRVPPEYISLFIRRTSPLLQRSICFITELEKQSLLVTTWQVLVNPSSYNNVSRDNMISFQNGNGSSTVKN